MITGDRLFRPGNPRYELQRAAVGMLHVVCWGRGSLCPKIPSGRFDVVTTQDPFWRGLYGLFVAHRKRSKLNVQVHTDLSAYWWWKRFLASVVLKRADTVRVVSHKIQQQVSRLGVSARSTVLPVYIDTERFHSVEAMAHDHPTILWIGRFEKEKDPLAAVRIFEGVLLNVPDARLVMLGAGSMQDALRKRAQKLPVEFPGWQDPVSYMKTTDVVLCTSLHESWGASIVEALLCGVPVVSPDVGVAKEAGATVVSRNQLTAAVIQMLREHARGTLNLKLQNKEEWVRSWKESLI